MGKKLILFTMLNLLFLLVCCGKPTPSTGDDILDEPTVIEQNYTVSFETGIGSDVKDLSVSHGNSIVIPNDPIRLGYTFGGWYKDSDLKEEYNFASKITSDITLYAKWISNTTGDVDLGYGGLDSGILSFGTGKVIKKGSVSVNQVLGVYEGAYIIFDKVSNANYNVYLSSDKEMNVLLDSDNLYIREVNGTMRADLLGIKPGKYEVKIAAVVSGVEQDATICEINVVEYDRSGYAHFNYNSGVGAYNNDGTLKEDAIVIYVTDENKDYVMRDIPKISEYMFNIPEYFDNEWNNQEAYGIGWWLNNTQYTKAEKDSSGNPIEAKSSNTYSPNGKQLGFYSVCENHPIVIRFVGTVTAPLGLTAYDSVNEGGSVGDNGFMARMKDLKNITLEGVGDDAIIKGWGFHFISNERNSDRGKSFEVRNLTFSEYPEDAIGMEGVQEGSTLVSPVERCWIHHITFLPGFCANPAESDKGEGDGSCDFKRGQYYTMSYCYYEYCHKTNLVGSSDSALQYNVSFHHNIWYNCASRIPLLRRANIHFYNNYVFGDANDDNISLSYVTSLRANCYMFSENNYYEGCKQVFDGKNGGVAKCYGNAYVSCFNSNGVLNSEVNSRIEEVNSNCSYLDISYENFDTNPLLFYYDETNKASDCYLTNAYIAKQECIMFAGSYYRTLSNKTYVDINDLTFNEYDIDSSIDLSNGSYTASIGNNDSGIIFNGVKSNKFRGQGITFKLAAPATVTLNISSSSSEALYDGYLVRNDGKVMLYGSGTILLESGVYYISSCQVSKDSVISSLTFEYYDEEEFYSALLNNYNENLSLLPSNISYNEECYIIFKDIMNAYNLLNDEYKSKVNYDDILKKYNNYLALGREHVIELINDIGVVDVNSGTKILLARTEYNKFNNIAKFVPIDEDVLIEAEKEFEVFAVQSCIAKIANIGDVTLDSKNSIEIALNEYDGLSEEQKSAITNYDVLKAAISRLSVLVNANNVDELILLAEENNYESLADAYEGYYSLSNEEVKELKNIDKLSMVKVMYLKYLISIIGNVTAESGEAIAKALEVKNNLNSSELTLVDNLNILDKAVKDYDNLVSQMYVKTFDDGLNDVGGVFTIKGNLKSGINPKEYNGVTYTTAMKIESSTSITFNIENVTKLTIVSDADLGDKIKVNGVVYTANDEGIFIIDLEIGAYTITKSTSINVYCLILG